ncbi:MAG: energy-coupling factor transporter ATPase [Acidobacteriota bacterium]
MSIDFEDVGFCYNKGLPFEKWALRNIDLTVENHEILGVVGPTGSGKSTLLQLMNGILLPSVGRVKIDGQETSKLKGKELTKLRRKVGLVFQFPEDQVFENTVLEDVSFGPRNLGIRGDELRQRVRWAMEAMLLDHDTFAERSPRTLSGGQRRRVAIAGVLAMMPDYLILDEPGAGLDAEGRRQLINIMCSLRDDKGIGIVFVSHRLRDILQVCDRVAIMADGGIRMLDTPRGVLSSAEQLGEYGLRQPQLNRIMGQLQTTYTEMRTDVLTIEEAAAEIDRVVKIQ